MFENLKNLQKLKQMQDDFKKEKLTVEKRGVTVVMNGNFEVEDVKLNSELNLEDQQDALKEALNEARENIQKTLAKSLMSSGLGF
ncbi:MAG: YbaB/EbfC family nucleoid-associated protein [Patescibacteria group bacterium]|mgnify:CR=1 FL=1